MKLKDLEKILRGSIKFKLQARVNENTETLDEVLISAIKYLPANLLKREVLQIDLDENIIFLDKISDDDTAVKKYVEIDIMDSVEDYSESFVNIKYEDESLI